jgi:uncharacterized membrane protein YcaP (DUF421 family)
MLFDDAQGLVRVAVIAVMAYTALVLALRMTGKRALAKLNAFDLVVTVALGSTLATVLLSREVALAEGVMAFAILMFLQWAVSRLSISSSRFRALVRSEPRLLVEQGCYRDKAMAEERIVRAEIDSAIRAAGAGRMEDIAAVILETDGELSVIKGPGPVDMLDGVRR